MKNLFVKNWYLAAAFAVFVLVLWFGGNSEAIQRTDDTVEGTEIVTIAHISTTGAWQTVSIPSTVENLRHVSIQVHNGTATDYTHIDNVVEFHVSSESDGTGWFYSSGITFAVGKEASEVICYIKAATSQKIAILGLR